MEREVLQLSLCRKRQGDVYYSDVDTGIRNRFLLFRVTLPQRSEGVLITYARESKAATERGRICKG
jgi:hypothetical protein